MKKIRNKSEKLIIVLSSGLFVAVTVMSMKLSGEGKTLQSLKADLESKKRLLSSKNQEENDDISLPIQPTSESTGAQVTTPASTPASQAVKPTPASKPANAQTPAPAPAPAPVTKTTRTS